MLALHDLRRNGYARHGAKPELRPGLLASAPIALAIGYAALCLALFVAPRLAPGAG
jgi:hypothetical protein